jgi:phage shock protein E
MYRMTSMVLLTLIGLMLVGCSAGNQMNATLINPPDYVEQFIDVDTPHVLVDVRTPEEYAEGFITGSVNIPLQELESRLSEIRRDIPVVVYCRSGNRSAQAADILTSSGYSEVYDLGGIAEWQQYGYRIAQES